MLERSIVQRAMNLHCISSMAYLVRGKATTLLCVTVPCMHIIAVYLAYGFVFWSLGAWLTFALGTMEILYLFLPPDHGRHVLRCDLCFGFHRSSVGGIHRSGGEAQFWVGATMELQMFEHKSMHSEYSGTLCI